MGNWLYRFLFGNPLRTLRTVLLLIGAAHVLYFIVIPHLLARRKIRSPRVRRYLEWVVATPSLLGDALRAEARHDLMRLAHMEGRHEQVVAQGLAIVRHAIVPAGMKAEVRGRLADALEGLGRVDEAQEQRRLAVADLKAADKTASWYVNRGRQLAAERDFASACRAYELGLEVAPEGPNDARALLTLHLANALFMAGRVEESAQRAEEATGLVHDRERLLAAHRQAGASYGTLGRLEEAESHRRRAVELAEAMGDPDKLADGLADLAELQRKRGRLSEALAACERAAAIKPTRHVEGVRYEILRSWGRFDEAFATNLRASRTDPNPTPRAEQMMQGIYAYGRAFLRMEQRRLEEVPALIEAAGAGVRGDAKLTVWCDAAGTRFAALQDRREEALRGLDRVERRLEDFAQDRNTCAVILSNLGRAALTLGEYDRALGYWEQYLGLPPTPVDLPIAYYHLGEALRGLGDETAARARYREAVATGLDTYYVQLAEARLRTALG
ncbi:MAG: tetratricopeptide repeat protein [Isosphaeraceae bacterium]|nr:tetratricopeptide repeat protein [Isosphaeraceae bacterium]